MAVTDTLVGQSTVVLNGRTLVDLGFGDAFDVSVPNGLTEIESGKDGSAIYAMNQSGRQVELKLRVIQGTPDDVFLNGLVEGFKANFAGATLINATCTKRTGNGRGDITTTAWVLSGGVPGTMPPDKWNVNGDPEQALMEYSFKFARGERQLS